MAFSFRHIFCIFHDVSLAAITTCSSHTTPPTEKGIKPSGFTREKPPKHEVTGLVTATNSLYVSPALNSIYGSHALFLIHCTTLLYRLYFMIFVPNSTKVYGIIFHYELWFSKILDSTGSLFTGIPSQLKTSSKITMFKYQVFFQVFLSS